MKNKSMQFCVKDGHGSTRSDGQIDFWNELTLDSFLWSSGIPIIEIFTK